MNDTTQTGYIPGEQKKGGAQQSCPTLSIIVPVYNVQPFLPASLDSIASQTFTDWECILVDDGSTDFSGMICDSYARRDPRFTVIHQKNAGVSTARNNGIEAAAGKYLTFVDPDDWLSENFFEVLLGDIKKHTADHSFSSTIAVDEEGQTLQLKTNLLAPKLRDRVLNDDVLLDHVFGMTCGCWGQIYHRRLWEGLRFNPATNLGEDTEIVPVAVSRAARSVYCPDAAYYYRYRTGSLLRQAITAERLNGLFRGTWQMQRTLAKEFPDKARAFTEAKLDNDLRMFFIHAKQHPQSGKSMLLRFLELEKEAMPHE